ncbi:phage baseplate assembly protein V [Thiolinea disciformis]|uniref:phage baseplate assembly protein V n=1 Tax=Thiolinea disciformis TaxID=125614 RepID=UPI00036BB9D4|nr:phage baseplate assembly protein V [Thiolinea disciformis]
MIDSLALIRTLIREELQQLRIADIAVVTSIFPHQEGDTHNYECNVKLRESNLELRYVPIATPHIGMVSLPTVGELVLLNYVHGDPNRAIVVGRLYSDKANPPVHEAKELHFVSSIEDQQTSIIIGKQESITIQAGKTIITIKKDGDIDIKGESQLSIETQGDVNVKCKDCKIDASGKIELGDGGSGVITEKSHKCYFTGKPLKASAHVKAK